VHRRIVLPLLLFTTGCTIAGEPDRLVTPPWAFRHASKSTQEIVAQLPPNEALEVLVELGRVEAPRNRSRITGKLALESAVAAERRKDEAEAAATLLVERLLQSDDEAAQAPQPVTDTERPADPNPRPVPDSNSSSDDAEGGGSTPGSPAPAPPPPSAGADASQAPPTKEQAVAQVMELVDQLQRQPTDRDLVRFDPDGSGTFETLRSLPRRDVLRSGHYFSSVTALAVEEGLRPTPIPALVLGYRPDLDDWSACPDFVRAMGLGFDLLVGGALNNLGNGGDDDSVELAVGLGITLPWSDSGALSLGVVTWRRTVDEGGDGSLPATLEDRTEVAFYVGISLGSFNVGSQEQ
jgi:hypothetical protein